ncbi:MAG: hypothetical protein HQ567_34325 [Candidatus Nealsonbacteria bacterium]|nr:hypothetical protein [Candidatus Nealsonbacteria bacterium]
MFYNVFGIGLLQTRAFGLICYVGVLCTFYLLVRQLGCRAVVAQMALLLVATDRSLVWQVRTGRPDIFAILLICASSYALVYSVQKSNGHLARLAASLGGAFALLAPLAHPYTVPAVLIICLSFFVALWRGKLFGLLLVPLLLGCLLPAIPYLGYLYYHREVIVLLFFRSSQFLNEVNTQTPGLGDLLRQEITQRWVPAIAVEPFRLVLALCGVAILWKRNRCILGIVSVWIVTYFLICWLKVPKDTHYQVLQITIPMGVLVAMTMEAAGIALGKREAVSTSTLARTVAIMWWCSFAVGIGLLMLYPLTAIMQWQERSHNNLVLEISNCIPRHSIVAVDPSAYFACLENDCRTCYWRLKDRGSWGDEDMQKTYQRGLLDRGVEYLVLNHTSSRSTSLSNQTCRIEFLDTIGMPKANLPFAKDPPYHFDVYRVVRAK